MGVWVRMLFVGAQTVYAAVLDELFSRATGNMHQCHNEQGCGMVEMATAWQAMA